MWLEPLGLCREERENTGISSEKIQISLVSLPEAGLL